MLSPTVYAEGNTGYVQDNLQHNPVFITNTPIPQYAVPYMTSYSDYVTNGNTLNQLYVSGDTVIVTMTYLDSAGVRSPNTSDNIRISYNYSWNGGTTWLATGPYCPISQGKSRYPDMTVIGSGSSKTVAASGRFWTTSTLRAAAVCRDLSFGVGNGVTYFVPGTGQSGNTDLFCARMSNGLIGCLYQNGTANDTIWFLTFNPTTNTYSSKVNVHMTNYTNTTCDYKIAAGTGGNLIIAYSYVNEPNYGGDPIRSERYQTSTDYGLTWSAPSKIMGDGIINGDSCQVYWHEDMVYKPNTSTPYIVFPTWDYSTITSADSTRKLWKIVIWSPILNSGNPVVVADYHNIPVLQDTNSFNLVTRVRTIHGASKIMLQVNASVLSHPSIGFSSDGNTIYCSYSVAQVDTSGEGFNFYDIWANKSTDGGATWSNPVNITNTQFQDEMYPCVARTGNDGGAKITYQSTRFPGCQGFGPTGMSPAYESDSVALVYQCYQAGVIGINNVSDKVPALYSLMQNYPNPFNPSTKIKFDIKNSAYITLKIYNVAGQLVTTLINNELVSSGTKEIDYNANSVASGVYFYTLNIYDQGSKNQVFSETRKMILLK